MRFYNETHKYTCGIDLHARNLYLCVFDKDGEKICHRRIANDGAEVLRVLKPYREDLVMSVESTFNWYWLGDLCAREKIPFVLGHAQYMKAVHQGKTKNDRVDSEKVSRLTAARMLPEAYVYPREMRKIRDLLRRRLYYVRERAALKGHVKIVGAQYNIALVGGEGGSDRSRAKLLACFADSDLQESIDCDLRTTVYLDSVIRRLEKYVLKRVALQDKKAFELLLTMPGIGNVLGLTILYEMHRVERFPRCQDFLSYARLVRNERSSNGEKVGKKGRKIGNPYLKWAFSEVAVHLVRISPEATLFMKALKQRYGAAGAWSRMSQKAARTAYFMLKNKEPFSMAKFLKNSERVLESVSSLEPQKEVAMVID